MTVVFPDPPWSPGGVGLSSLEIETNRALTHTFIDTMPVVVTLIPRSKEPKPAGGFTWVDDEPREPQTMRLIEPSSYPNPVLNVDGIERRIEFELLGEWDAEIGVYDRFDHDGRRWEVISLIPANGYEQRANVARIG